MHGQHDITLLQFICHALGSVDVWFTVALARFSRQIKAVRATNSPLFEHEITKRCREKRPSPAGLAALGLTLRYEALT
ncbi:hypothetical protein K4H28_15535 [Deefgea tanakiae]|jgi:hypothetical protein|uniref:Uncharacterized protein n=1 Tax=Deefgea tanakiae TaxID=2865840 RepID=A0ABX8Z9X1_9NEIS|nr:hypothetical protein [Deefgea tanakiae]QZA77659.1 hypothetical protein K4H28_15535 [Deefgea tanakiae]